MIKRLPGQSLKSHRAVASNGYIQGNTIKRSSSIRLNEVGECRPNNFWIFVFFAGDFGVMFNPIELAETHQNIVCKNNQRKILPFQIFKILWRYSNRDCVGCCLRCNLLCWSWNVATRPQECGHFSSPEEVAGKLIAIAKSKKNCTS